MTHGTPSAYTHGKCRCEDCKRAWRDYSASKRRERAESPGSAPRARTPRFIELLRYEMTPDGARPNLIRAQVIRSTDDGWQIFLSADDWVEAAL